MDRSKEIKDLVSRGLSSRQIGNRLDICNGTVIYWVKKLGLKLKQSKNDNGVRGPKLNLTGKTFGFLTVKEMVQDKNSKGHPYRALCYCSNCGNENFLVMPRNIIEGFTTSCGCRIDFYEKIKGKNSTQYTGYKDITGTYWKRIKSRRGHKHQFLINIKEAYTLYEKQGKKCALSNLPIKFGRSNYFIETTASLDRIDSTKDYTIDNV